MILRKKLNTDKRTIIYPVLELNLTIDPIFLDDKMYIISYDIKKQLGKALLRINPPDLITIVSPKYIFVTHERLFSNVEDILTNNGIEFKLFDINEGGKNRNRAYINYILPAYKFSINTDEWIPYIQAYNCYDKFMSYGLLTGLYRIQNESALLIFDKKILASRRHVRKNIELKEDILNVKEWISKLGELRRTIQNLTEQWISNNAFVENIVRKVIKVKKHQQIFYNENILTNYINTFGNNYYSLLISLMEYATHGLWNKSRKRSYDRSRNAQMEIANIFLKK